jgi:hypothetical protein
LSRNIRIEEDLVDQLFNSSREVSEHSPLLSVVLHRLKRRFTVGSQRPSICGDGAVARSLSSDMT